MHPLSQTLSKLSVVLLALAFSFVSCGGGGGNDNGRVVNVTGVTLDRTSLELSVNEEMRLVATVIPSNATNQMVSWVSDKSSVASVTNGRVFGAGVGDARITVTTENGGYRAQCDVYVRNIPVQSVSLNPSSLNLIVGNTSTLVPSFYPANASNRNVSWQSSSPSVASVEGNGVVRATSPGTATITVTTQDGGKQTTCAVAVLSESVAVRVTGVSLNKTSIILNQGGTDALTAYVQPPNATNPSISWSSSNTAVASVSPSGVVSGISTGNASITVTTSDRGYTANCAVNVVATIVPVTAVSLNKTSLTLNVSNSETLTPTIQPSNATNKGVSWNSNNQSVATVDGNGLVRAIAPGSAAITVSTQDGGKTATCNVTVPTPPADVYVAGTVGNNSSARATLWKNGTAQTLSTVESYAYGVFVSGGDVYVAGAVYTSYGAARKPTVWKNGVAQTLPTSMTVYNDFAYSVFVSGDDVYVAGKDSGKATLWKNGVAQTLSNGNSSANGVYASGSNVCVAGTVSGTGSVQAATLWRNGWAETLPSANYISEAHAVFLSGNDVYVAGTVGNNSIARATLWKNGVEQTLSSASSIARAVFVSGNDVYVAGDSTLWKNGTAQSLPFSANSVFVYGSDVYVAGQQNYGAALWKNGQSMTLGSSATANSVFVAQMGQ